MRVRRFGFNRMAQCTVNCFTSRTWLSVCSILTRIWPGTYRGKLGKVWGNLVHLTEFTQRLSEANAAAIFLWISAQIMLLNGETFGLIW